MATPGKKTDNGQGFSVPPDLSSSNIAQDVSRMPGGQTNQGDNINWLGSSYSGVDIKVVVHLYTPASNTNTINLQTQLKQAQAMSKILHALSGGGGFLSMSKLSDIRSYFTTISGASSSTEDQAALMYAADLWNACLSDPNPDEEFTFLCSAEGDRQYRVSQDLQTQINNLQKVQAKALQTVELATLQTLSVQTYREKEAVRACGSSYVKGYTRGNRTIGGSMIFTIFNEFAFASLLRAMGSDSKLWGEMGDTDISSVITDQLPPLDLTIIFANEYGSISQMGIYGVEFMTDGMTMSIEDLLSEEVCQFVARDVDVMTSQGNMLLSRLQRNANSGSGTADQLSGSNLLISSDDKYQAYLKRLGLSRNLSSK